MSSLPEFLLDRIVEDLVEASSLHPDQQHGEPWNVRSRARMLAGCERDRRIVEMHTGGHECPESVEWSDGYYDANELCPTIRLLALPYADHPDYDPRWRP